MHNSWLIRWIPGFIRRDFLRKGISVFFALLVWSKVNSQIGEIRVMGDVRPQITAEQGIEVIDYYPKEFSLDVRGTAQQLNRISNPDFKIAVNVPATKAAVEGRLTLRIDPYEVKAPGGVRVVAVNPSEITLHLDRNLSKIVPVVPEFSEAGLPEEYARGEVKLNPPMVTISGPETLVGTIQSVAASKIILDRSTIESFKLDISIPSPDKKVRVAPSTVAAEVEIYQRDDTLVLENLPVGVMQKQGAALYAKLESGHVSVTLKGSKTALESLDTGKIKVFVDISKFTKPGSYMAKVDCWVNSPQVEVKFIIPSYRDLEVKGEAQGQ